MDEFVAPQTGWYQLWLGVYRPLGPEPVTREWSSVVKLHYPEHSEGDSVDLRFDTVDVAWEPIS